MVEFGSGYYMPMDREYGHNSHVHNPTAPSNKGTNDVGVSIGDFGLSLALGPTPNLQALQSKFRIGAKKVEFTFMGAGKGQGQAHTPEMYGKKQRVALEEMGKANRVDFTTHATVGVYGLAGQGQQGSFSKEAKANSVQEIKRAIEFAADVARGGPVVVHTGEFSRPIIDSKWNHEDDEWKDKFEMFPGEEERSSYRVVDSRHGQLIQEARKNRKVARPVWNRYDEESESWKEHNGGTFTDTQGSEVKPGDYIDYNGNKLDPESRIPRYDSEKQHFEVKQMGWNELVDEADEMTTRAREVWRDWKSGKMTEDQFDKSYWLRFKEAKSEEDIEVRPEEAYIISTYETNAATSRGYAYYYGGNFDDHIKRLRQLEEAKEFYEKIEEEADPEQKWRLKREADRFSRFVPADEKFPTEFIDKEIREQKRQIKYSQESSASQWAQAEEMLENIRYVESAETYAFREACDAYADSAVSAMTHSDKLEKQGKLKKPMALAMENLFPETYGSHPDELIDLIKGTRKRMAEKLMQRGFKEKDANERARTHVTSTFDTGHLNMWRKYWKGDPNKTIEQNDKEFDGWMLQKLGKMIDEDILGHVHVDDNYGYHDDHLAPGEGNTPIKEMIHLMKKKGYKGELIVEPGADFTTDTSGMHSLTKTWRLFGNPVYGAGSGIGPSKRSWNQVGYGWFGQNQPAYFTFGAYSPGEDWTLWSGVQLE